MKFSRYLFVTSFLILLASCQTVNIPLVSDLANGMTVEQARQQLSTDPITTSFGDADESTTLPDDFARGKAFRNMAAMPRSINGGYMLSPGYYELTTKSFCIKAGTHGPSAGDGYLFASLEGKRKTVVQKIVREWGRHPEIRQRSVQQLLWAIIAKTKFSKLSPKLKVVAATLLPPDQLMELNGGALGLIPDKTFRKAVSTLPRPVRNVMEAERKLRRSLTQAGASYAEVERIAVLAGSATVDRPDIRRGRWSRHRRGFYVRYLPSGYARTVVQVYVPNNINADNATGSLDRTFIPRFLQRVEYDGSGDVAVPANTGSQRLLQSNEPTDDTRPEEPDSEEPEEPGESCKDMLICIEHPVKHIQQNTNTSCWAAAGGMATGASKQLSTTKANLRSDGTLDPTDENIRKFAQENGLKYNKLPKPTPEAIEKIMQDANGPLWVAGQTRDFDSGRIILHAKVISKMTKRDAGSKSDITVHDPAYDQNSPDDSVLAVGERPLDYFLKNETAVTWVLHK